ncbi:MAG: class I SAM-dependent methyltransferase [Gemmatimonadetes bacterium]|jgi:ubiquinone/menaquinone biosynthesis C-methylase UbiE|nr:class I SAM-dependent methyltransferase [Gemmatimonadota bacterium]MBT6149845.1 class I SAM-dependent methyltransferase [Gemmatimonadota bacterium]MBT7864683.1 class I SAM-dependent methyltransferase [Gemmatimonadota bacterium]
MGIYSDVVLPRLIDRACRQRAMSLQRRRIVPRARGEVLEVGIGTGLNLPFYDAERVTKVFGLDPSQQATRMARESAEQAPFEVDFIGLPGEEIPLDDHSVDTVVMTYTLCSIAAPDVALKQMARVLRPGGELLFCEHGAAPDASVRRWQDRLNPVWKRLGGGCNLNRDIFSILKSSGFDLAGEESGYIAGWRPGSYNYWGSATAS